MDSFTLGVDGFMKGLFQFSLYAQCSLLLKILVARKSLAFVIFSSNCENSFSRYMLNWAKGKTKFTRNIPKSVNPVEKT